MTRLLAAAVTATLVGAGLAATVTAQPAYAMPTLPVVAAGGYHSCALMPDRTVWCWGQNTTGQLGDGIKTDSLAPVQVTGLPPAVNVATGEYHSCAVSTSSTTPVSGAGVTTATASLATARRQAAPSQCRSATTTYLVGLTAASIRMVMAQLDGTEGCLSQLSLAEGDVAGAARLRAQDPETICPMTIRPC